MRKIYRQRKTRPAFGRTQFRQKDSATVQLGIRAWDMSNHHMSLELGPAERILKAALGVFATYGFEGATTREIARRANVKQPQISYHFESKELLWKAAADTIFEEFDRALKANMQDAVDDDDRLYRLVRTFVSFVARNPEWFAFVIHEGFQAGERNQWLIKKWLKPQSQAMYRILIGKKWPKMNGRDMSQAMSILSILSGSTGIFAQRFQVEKISGLNILSDDFISAHARNLCIAIKNVV